jgi:hypothetical protein
MFAHGALELNYLTYRRSKTEMCLNFRRGVCHKRPCGRAHNEDEVVVIKFKTSLCRSFIGRNSCQYNDRCQFAHGMKELKSPWDEQPITSKASSLIGEQPTGEQPTGEQPIGEQPTGEQPFASKASTSIGKAPSPFAYNLSSMHSSHQQKCGTSKSSAKTFSTSLNCSGKFHNLAYY